MKILLLIIIGCCAAIYMLGKTNNSYICHNPLIFQNPTACRVIGCIWGNGDLTGPPFCGAYKE